jgi:tRNA pseudouridine13 synthase
MMRLSKNNQLGSLIKQSPEDFIVEEITKTGKVLEVNRTFTPQELGMNEDPEGKFVTFILQKKDWNTLQALNEIARMTHRGMRSVSFAGTKDRTAVSTQLCSIYGADKNRLASTHIKDIKINAAWQSSEGVKMGELLGNRFTIAIKNIKGDISSIKRISEELDGLFPNYFGEQRFGIRSNNFNIGVSILKGDFESCAMNFLTDTTNERNLDSIEARERLAKERDFVAAMDYFPGYLKYERSVIQYLSQYPTDFANAMRKLPRQLMLMFVHSVESMIFNMEIEERIKSQGTDPIDGDVICGRNAFGFPDFSSVPDNGKGFILGNIVGYQSEKLNEIEMGIMEKIGISKESFKVSNMPELNCKGSRRVLFAPFNGFSTSEENNGVRFSFSLPSGSYATVLLDEFVKSNQAEHGTV